MMLSTKTLNLSALPFKLTPILVTKANESCFASKNSVLPTQAQVVICGAGAVANSVAYHLTENGWTDVLLIDKGK